jgi:hypothetical protein
MMMKKILIVIFVAVLFTPSCTKVDEVVYDKYAAAQFYSSPQGADVALANVYSQIPGNWDGVGYAGADRGWYDVNCMSTDEQVVPHRTTGDWELTFAQLYLRQWLPDHAYLNNTWNWLYKSVFSANLAVDLLQQAEADPSKIAEAKVLRAFFYYLLMDDFGSVPFYTENNVTVDQMPQKSRKEIFDFVVAELVANVDKLSTERGGNYYGRFNRWAGYALLAKVYLNAEVYTGTPMWAECIEACNKVDEGGFSLHSSAADASNPLGSKYFELFGDVCPNDETILAIYTKVDVVGRNIFTVRSFGGVDGTSMLGYSAWNGTVVPVDFLSRFDDNDIRKHQFRYGDNPFGPKPAGFLVYSVVINNLDNPGAAPNAGARSQKFWPAEPSNGGGASNDFPIYRYADIMLMKAECMIRTGDDGSAQPLVNAIRERAGLSALTGGPSLDDIYKERSCELSWEGHRRQDMIRFGTFTQAHGLAPAVSSNFNLFPIPTAALNANPNLQQNPGF